MSEEKRKNRILVSDKLVPEGLEILRAGGENEVVSEPGMSPEALADAICDFDALVIRSGSQVTSEVIARADRLKVIGRAGVGVDNIDVEAATERGIIVMNTPGGNTISTAEHSISMMLALVRNIPRADATMKQGKWEKKSLGGAELYGKTLGVLGLGRIGREVARRMRAFEMDVIAYDPFLAEEAAAKMGVELTDVDDICRRADIITVHTPLNDETRGLINAERIAMMKPTALLINCARGGIIDEDALAEGLNSGRIAGAAIDVFTVEPLPEDHPLRKAKNIVLSPHLAASTTEAQEKVAREIARQVVDVLRGAQIRNAVNVPSIDPRELERLRPVLDLTTRLGSFIAQFAPAPFQRIEIHYSGTPCEFALAPMTAALVKGFLRTHTNSNVNEVNALFLAKSRGIEVVEIRSSETHDYSGLIMVVTHSECGRVNSLGGTLFHGRDPHLVMVNGKHIDVRPEGTMLVIQNRDVPGIVGLVGTALGAANVNISDMTWGRTDKGGEAITVLNVDDDVPSEVIEQLRAHPDIVSVDTIVI